MAGTGWGPEQRCSGHVGAWKSGCSLSAQHDHAENQNRKSTGDRTDHQGSTHGILLSRHAPLSWGPYEQRNGDYADFDFLLRRMMTPTTTTANASATTRTIMDDSIVNLLSGSPDGGAGAREFQQTCGSPVHLRLLLSVRIGRSQQHNEQARKDEEDQGKQNLDFGFGGRFFGALTARNTDLLGITAEGADDGRAEAVGLLQHGDEGGELLEFGAVGHALPGVEAGLCRRAVRG